MISCKTCLKALKSDRVRYWRCVEVINITSSTPVINFMSCKESRMPGGPCGPDAKLWVDTEKIDSAISSILTELGYLQWVDDFTPSAVYNMRWSMRKIMSDFYIDGSNAGLTQ